MKKISLAFMAIILAVFASCNKVEPTIQKDGEYNLSFEIADPSDATKAIKSTWAEGDEIMIFFNNKVENGQQALLRYVSGAWTVITKPSDLGLSAGNYIYFYAIHFPGSISYDKSLSIDKQLGYKGGNVRKCSKEASVSADGTIALGTVQLADRLYDTEYQVVVPGISVSDGYTLSVTSNGKLQSSVNAPADYTCAYGEVYYPYFTGTGITFGGGLKTCVGVTNADGVAYTLYYKAPTGIADTDTYKYVFTLCDSSNNKYYYTIEKASSKTLAAKKAIKIPTFDGKSAGSTNWKTSF